MADDNPTGLSRPAPHPAYVVGGLILLVIAVLIILRISGYLPRQAGELKTVQQIGGYARSYIPLGTIDNRLFYFDRNSETICEDDKGSCRNSGALPSVEAAIISPDRRKIALLSVKEQPRSGIYVLEPTNQNEARLSPTVKADRLPPGYVFQADSAIVWSQESKQIAFVAYKDAHADIFVAPVDAAAGAETSNQQPPTAQSTRIEPIRNPGSQVGTVVWRGEQKIVFVTDMNGKDAMYEVDNNGGGIVRVKPN